MAAGNSKGASNTSRTRWLLWWLRAEAEVLKQAPTMIKAARATREVLRNSMMFSLVVAAHVISSKSGGFEHGYDDTRSR